MGIRRKKVSDELWERVLELRKIRKPKEVYELLKGTKSEISLSEIYRIRGPKSKKAKEAGVPQELLDSLRRRLLNLPPLINQAQKEHLEGKEQRHEFGGEFHVITYSVGTGIRQLLGLFQGCFSDIDSRFRSFWRPLDGGEIAMSQLRGHLRDEVFWDRVKDFAEKAGTCLDPAG